MVRGGAVVQVAQGCPVRPPALEHLLVHALADLFSQVAEVELGDGQLYVAQKLSLGRVGNVAGDVSSPSAHDLFEQYLVGEVAIQAVELVRHDHPNIVVRLEEVHHLREALPPRPPC